MFDVVVLRDALTELLVLLVLGVVVLAFLTFDVERLSHLGVPQHLILFEILADQFRVVKVQAVFAISSCAPPAAVEHAPCIACFLVAIMALVLWAVEISPAGGLDFEIVIEASVVIRSGASFAQDQGSTVHAHLADLRNVRTGA